MSQSKRTNRFGLQEQQRKSGTWYRADIRDPLNGKTLVFQGPDALIVAAQRDEIKRLTMQLKAGFVSPEEVQAQRARVVGGVVTLARCVETYLGTVSESSLKPFRSAWECRLKTQLGELAVVELTKSRMATWEKEEAAKGLSQKTISNAFCVARSAVNLAVSDGLVAQVPWGDYTVRCPKEEHLEAEITRDMDELKALVMAARAHDEERMQAGAKWSCMWIKVVVATYLALRQGEIAGAGWDDLRLRGGPSIIIRHQVTPAWRTKHPEWDRPLSPPKGRRECVLPLPEDVLLVLAIQKKALEKLGHYRPDGPIFPAQDGTWRGNPEAIENSAFKRIFMSAIPEAVVTNVSAHGLRHGGATLTLKALGGDLGRAKQITRHRTTRMFELYMHAASRDKSHPMENMFVPERAPLPLLDEAIKGPMLLLPASVEVGPKRWEQVELVDASVHEALATLRALPEYVCDARLEIVDELAAEINLERFQETNEEKIERLRREARRETVRRSKAKKSGRLPLDLHKTYDAWCASGRVVDVPEEVMGAANGAYARAYVKAKRADKLVRWNVSRTFSTWEALARELLSGDEPSPAQIEAIRAANIDMFVPPKQGEKIGVPAEIEAIRRGRLARRGYIGGWFRIVRKRDTEQRRTARGSQGERQDTALELLSS